MSAILISNIISTKVLSSRPSARLLEPATEERAALATYNRRLTFDLRGKLAMAPSFFDELIRIVLEQFQRRRGSHLRIELLNVPSEASSKFHAVCRSHRLSLTEPAPGHWIIANS